MTTLNRIAIYPGSFDPFHEGHQSIIDYALRKLGLIVVPEISSARFQKADRSPEEMDRIAKGIPLGMVIQTKSSLMRDKYHEIKDKLKISDIDLIVGADTFDRMMSCYGDDVNKLLSDIQFEVIHVFPRANYEPRTINADYSNHPRIMVHLGYSGPAISSTEIRNRRSS